MNAAWTVKVERLEIHLPVGIHADEIEAQPVWVSLTATGSAPASPRSLDDCFDYEPLCRWLSREWPLTPHTPLLEQRVNQLFHFVFGLDERVQTVWAGIYKQRMSHGAMAVGIEREATRIEFEAQTREAAVQTAIVAAGRSEHRKEFHADA